MGTFLHGKMKNLVIEVGGKCAEVMVNMYPEVYGDKIYKGKLYLKLERELRLRLTRETHAYGTETSMVNI